MREIGAALGINSTNGVRYFLDVLEERGFIRRDPGLSRGIHLSHRRGRSHGLRAIPGAPPARGFRVPGGASGRRQDSIYEIPIVGDIAAGAPILAEQNVEGTLNLDSTFLAAGSGAFALRVRGDSMRDAGILPGDLVIVRPDPSPANGDIVVAYWEGEATVKRFLRSGNRITLHPENPAFEDIRVHASQEDFRVLGIVAGVIRRVK
jgi:repressor LexA